MFNYIMVGVGVVIGVIIAALFYELPYIGRLEIYSDAQVKIATEKLVSQAELDAANARADKATRDAALNLAAADAARKQADNAEIEKQESTEKLNARIAADTATDDGGVVGKSDIEWLRNN